MYDKSRLKSDMCGGIFNGMIFSGCWGLINGSYYTYTPHIPVFKYFMNIAKYTGYSTLLLTPLFTLARVTNNYCRESGYNATQSSLMTFGVCLTIMILLKNRINL